MQARSVTPRLGAGTAQVAVPVFAALILGVIIMVWLAPGFGLSFPASTTGVLRIYASVPRPDYDSIVHGAQMAIDAQGTAAGSKIEYHPLNDATLHDGGLKWDAQQELANARQAVADPTGVIYLGTYNSGAAQISIPVLNRVHLAMISPGNTYPGLTKPGQGTAGEPWTYYPLGIRSYFRVVPADDLQGAAGAAYAQQLGAKKVYVLDDTELYGHGIAVIFAQEAAKLGLQVVGGPESIDVRKSDYTDDARRIVSAAPDLVYFGGITANHAGLVLRDLRKAGFQGTYMGADGIGTDDFLQQAGGTTGGPVYSTLVGLPAAQLPGAAAQAWYRDYKSRWPGDHNEDFAPYGYEAALVALSAIDRAGPQGSLSLTDYREKIRQEVARTTSDNLGGKGILGPWRFDANGDTSLIGVSVLQLNTSWDYIGGMVKANNSWSFKGK